MIENLLMYTCAKHCHKRWSSDKAIATIKRCSFFLPHSVCSITVSRHWLSLLNSFLYLFIWFSAHVNVPRCISEREARHAAPDVDRRFWCGQVCNFACFVFAHWVSSDGCLAIGCSLSLWKCSMYYIQLPFEPATHIRTDPMGPWTFSSVSRVQIFPVIDVFDL